MLALIFTILMLMVFGKLLVFAIKAAWGITRIFFTIILLPLALIGLAVAGFMYIALVLVAMIGVILLMLRWLF